MSRRHKRRNIKGDDLDEDYLKGESDYVGIFLILVVFVVLATIYYSK